MRIFHKNYDELFGLDNLFLSWRSFRRGKSAKTDVMNFELHLEDNLFNLYEEMASGRYRHSAYKYFQIFDNKKRDIYKAEVRDRVVHQIVYRYLLSIFEPDWIADSYASRIGKGQYKAINAFRYFIKLAGDKYHPVYILKCDVRKYFDNINQQILLNLIKIKISDDKIFAVIKEIIGSYHSVAGLGEGIPLGNVTSQVFANIYLSELDDYVKKELNCRFYVRYNDDLIIASRNRDFLEQIRFKIITFVKNELSLEIPLAKTSLRKIGWGVDFLGFIVLPEADIIRGQTKDKIFSRISQTNRYSYLGILKHCNSYNLRRKILSMEETAEI